MQKTLAAMVQSPGEVAATAMTLLERELQPGRLFRLVGVGVSGFEPPDDDLLQPRLVGFE